MREYRVPVAPWLGLCWLLRDPSRERDSKLLASTVGSSDSAACAHAAALRVVNTNEADVARVILRSRAYVGRLVGGSKVCLFMGSERKRLCAGLHLSEVRGMYRRGFLHISRLSDGIGLAELTNGR